MLCLHRPYRPLSLLHSSLADSQNGTGLTDQTLLICYSAKNFLTLQRVFVLISWFRAS